MELFCPVSLGEILDKISVLRIKLARIKDASKLPFINQELDRLNEKVRDIAGCEQFIAELTVHNTVIWDVEDALRMMERKKQFDAEFIELARSAPIQECKPSLSCVFLTGQCAHDVRVAKMPKSQIDQ
jgi:hypothetical protein